MKTDGRPPPGGRRESCEASRRLVFAIQTGAPIRSWDTVQSQQTPATSA
jgi:hypothetical protein